MRIGRMVGTGRLAGQVVPIVDNDGISFDLRSLATDIDGSFLAGGGVERVAGAVRAGSLDRVASDDDFRRAAPVARPTAVVCIGQNYAAHAAESGSPPPERPIVFFKHPNTVIGPNDDIVRPDDADALDYEVELAVVIAAPAWRVADHAAAMACVAGYTISNDVSERVWQIQHSGGQWSKGKCAPTFNPLGPWLIPASDVADPQALRLRSWVNGEKRQDSSTADMIFPVAELILQVSHYMRLEPGDVLNTGTPEGVAMSGKFPFLQTGDTFAAEIDGLGRMEQRIVAEPERRSS